MSGHKDYEFLGVKQRKTMLAYFSSFVRKPPSPISRSSTAAASSKTRRG